MPDAGSKGKRLLLLAGLAPKRDEPDGDEEDVAPADDEGGDPSPEALKAAGEAMSAASDGDKQGFAKAILRMINAR